jgi:hypothetical protein
MFRSTIAVTLNGGMRMPSWFDLKSLDPCGVEDEDGIKKAAEVVRKFITDEVYFLIVDMLVNIIKLF